MKTAMRVVLLLGITAMSGFVWWLILGAIAASV